MVESAVASLSELQVKTPLGLFRMLANGHTVLVSAWCESDEELRGLLPAVYRDQIFERSDAPHPASVAVANYFKGELDALSSVETVQPTTEFRRAGADALRRIPPAKPVTYSELAAMMGNPRAVRAAASVCSKNPVALFVPCHRVVPAGGGVGKYAFGSERKAALLQHESANVNT